MQKVISLFCLLIGSYLYGHDIFQSEAPVLYHKNYPKKDTFEIQGPSLGYVLNQSYLHSLVVQTGLVYNLSEQFSLLIDMTKYVNIDKSERYCLESYYNQRNNELSILCASEDQDPIKLLQDDDGQFLKSSNLGPVYPEIRALEHSLSIAVTWSPLYGKVQLGRGGDYFFDFFLTTGVGATKSSYQPMKTTTDLPSATSISSLRGPDRENRNDGRCYDGDDAPGICPQNHDLNFVYSQIGKQGRPPLEQHLTSTALFAVGHAFHINQNVQFKIELRSQTLVGTDRGIEPYLIALIGTHVRI